MKVTAYRSLFLRRILPAFLILGSATAHAADAPAPAAEPVKAPAGVPTIFVVGDSTAKNTGRGVQGWGTAIEAYFDASKAKINNVAHAGQSSLTYYNIPTDWPAALPQIKKGDYVFIVFGINDGGSGTPPGLGDETKDVTVKGKVYPNSHTFGWYMAKMATDSLEKGAHVYLLTNTARNEWTNPKATFAANGVLKTKQDGYNPAEDKVDQKNWGRYPEWTKAVGANLHVPVIDLANIEAQKMEEMGREKTTANYPADHNHTSPAGADVVAGCVVAGLKAFKDSPLTALLSEKGKEVKPAAAKFVFENAAPDKAAASKPAASAK